MRIGLLIYGSLDTVSGGYLYDRMLVEHLRRQGDEVELVFLPWRNYPRHLGDNFSSNLQKRLDNLDVDVLVQDELCHPSLFRSNQRISKERRYPIVALVHHLRSSELHPAWQTRLYTAIERSYLRSVDGYIFNSLATRRSVAALQGLSSPQADERPWIVANPAGNRLETCLTKLPDEQEIARRAQWPGPLRLLFVGNLIPRKGLHNLLAALQQLPPETCTLTVVGSPDMDRDYARRIKRQMEHSRLDGSVSFSGPLEDRKLAAQMNASQVLVVPSSYEGYGIVYLEGMGFGLPAIGASAGGAGEIITHNKDGFLLPADDANTLAATLAELANDRQRLQTMGLAARQRYLAHPTWEQTCERLRAFLGSLSARN